MSYMSYIISKCSENLYSSPSLCLQVVYAPFVPDMIARVDADRAGSTVRHSSVGRTLPVPFFLTPHGSVVIFKTLTLNC